MEVGKKEIKEEEYKKNMKYIVIVIERKEEASVI